MSGEGAFPGNDACRRLIVAAVEVFARHGLKGARVRQIADAARVNLAAVNYYFGGKEGLYRATLRHLSQAGGDASVATETPEQALQRRVRGLIDRVHHERPALGRILAHEAMAPTGNLSLLFGGTCQVEIAQLNELLCEIARLRATVEGEK